MISSRLHKPTVLFAVTLLSLFAFGCGSENPASSFPSGTLFISVQDAPLDDLVKFEITVTGIVLTPGDISVLPLPEEIELTSLQLTPEIVRLSGDIPIGTYTAANLTFANPELKYRDTVNGDPARDFIVEIKPPLVNSSVAVPVTLNVTEGQAIGLSLDFDLAASVVTDAGGDITGIDPMVTAAAVNPSLGDNEFDDVPGRVVSVSASGDTGSFVFESFQSCEQFTLNVDASTVFERFEEASPALANEFASLAVDQVIEAEADILPDGTMNASKIKFEDSAIPDELEGIIVAVTRDVLEQVTDFSMIFFDAPTCPAAIPDDERITVSVPTDGSVRFRIQDEEFVANPALFDDSTDLDVGQKVDVEPVEPFDPATTSYTADKIKLNRQTLRGTVLSVSATTFELAPAGSLLPDASITVQVSAATRFDSPATGLPDLTVDQAVRVKGLLVRDAAGEMFLAAMRIRLD